MRRLVQDYFMRRSGRVFAAIACMLIVAACSSLTAWLLQPVIEQIFQAKNREMLIVLPAVIIVVGIVKAIAAYGQGILIADVSRWLSVELQSSLFKKLMHADIARMKDDHSGTYHTHFLQNANLVANSSASAIVGVFREIPTAIGMIVVMFIMDWQLSLAALLVVPFIAALTGKLSKSAKKSIAGTIDMSNRLAKQIAETLAGIRIVRAYGQEAAETDRAGGLIRERMVLLMKAQRASLAAAPLTEAFAAVGIAIVIFVGGSRVISGSLEMSAFFPFIAALLMAFQPIRGLSNLSTVLAQGVSAAEQIFAELDVDPKITDRPGARALQLKNANGAHIQFNKVCFEYGDNAPVLHDLSLEANPGETVALVGPSGGGKSTMLNLILRFYEAGSGELLIDGQEIGELTMASLRDKVALVTQESVLFDDSVRANIAYGVPDADEQTIVEAAKLAAADEFIRELPNGYDTRVGEDGGLLSGGQRQRIAIARAFVKDAPILLLDEATSALDAASEQKVQDALKHLMKGRTTFVIAHRLSTIQTADRIFVLDGGKIVENGTHDNLMATNGLYAALYESQFENANHSAA